MVVDQAPDNQTFHLEAVMKRRCEWRYLPKHTAPLTQS